MVELQRTAGNRAVGRLVAQDPARRPGPVVQRRRPAGEYGLDAPTSEQPFAAKAVALWRTQKAKLLTAFADDLLGAVVADLMSRGVPEVTWKYESLGVSGLFDSKLWVIKVDVDAFGSPKGAAKKVGDLSVGQFREVVGTLYHEARHADQDVLVVRQLLAAKVPTKDIAAQTKIRGDVVDDVKKTSFKQPLNATTTAHAKRMFDVMYGAHNQVLTFLMDHGKAVEGVDQLTLDGSDLHAASAHVAAFTTWQSTVLQARVAALKKATRLSPTEQVIRTDLDAVNEAVLDLADVWNAVPDKKNPTPAAADDVRAEASKTLQKLNAAYRRLESEQDAFRVEGELKAAFDSANRAWKPPKPAKPKRKPKK